MAFVFIGIDAVSESSKDIRDRMRVYILSLPLPTALGVSMKLWTVVLH